jgi:hypothetical protein
MDTNWEWLVLAAVVGGIVGYLYRKKQNRLKHRL